jgi:flagellar basal-body rod modification protein FlgD
MNVSDINSVMGTGASAATTVASALSPRPTAKDATATSDTTSSTASTAATDNSTITSSDFLTLLVTELKNQDPTQPTDPNAYIQQLVGVNSLQQLISINQDLTSVPTSTAATTPTSASSI